MDAPPILYARTDDGVDIAYWTVGTGPTLMFLPGVGGGHAQFVWDFPEYRRFLEQLGAGRTLVYLDHRGTGLSAPVDSMLVANLEADIRAVVGQLDAPVAAIFAQANADTAAVRYLADQPETLTRLVLFNPHPAWEPTKETLSFTASFGLIDRDYDLWMDLMAPALMSKQSDAAEIEQLRTLFRLAHSAEALKIWLRDLPQHRLLDHATQLAAPTLVIGRRDFALGLAREVAGAIPDAQLTVVEGDSPWAFNGPFEPIIAAVNRFVPADPDQPEEATLSGVVRTLLFTDLESSTALTQSLGDAKAQEVLRGHNAAVRTALEAHGGEEVKHTGDGIMAAFGSAVSAVEAALQIQRELADAEVRVRVGLNAGEPIAEDDDYFGAAVQLAARVCDRAEPGQVLVPSVVRDLCRGKGFTFADQGEATLKGFPEPVRLFVVGQGA